MAIDLSRTDTKEYILRPEAVEGWWYMMELSESAAPGRGDKYRDWGWRTFLNFERHLRVAHGYASIQDVTSQRPRTLDRMESFFLAETLKYLYLLQDQKRQIRLDTHVFNTEAHPFRIAG
jgi:mannosyl-oligosaccharide alpha-1,2-mannosidase